MLAHLGNADESLSLVMLFAGIWMGWGGWSRLRGKGFPRMPLPAAYGLIGGAAVMVVAATFVPRALLGPPGAVPTPASSGVRPASTATLAIAKPTPGEVVGGSQLEVLLTLSGGTIASTASTTLTSDTGHIHLSIDGKLASMTYGTVQVLNIASLSPGPHTLTAEFVANDHGTFNPRVTQSVTFRKAAA